MTAPGATIVYDRLARVYQPGEEKKYEEAERKAQAAQKMAGIRVDHVIAAFSGSEPRSYGLAGKSDALGTTVYGQERSRALSPCAALSACRARHSARRSHMRSG